MGEKYKYQLKLLNVVRETDSAEKRDFLLSQGYTLLEEKQEGKPDAGSAPSGLADVKLADLKRYAEENGIDISGLKTKKEIAEAICAAEEAAGDGGENDADDEREDGTAG